jgi:4'-phosphopantetheinyl transferase
VSADATDFGRGEAALPGWRVHRAVPSLDDGALLCWLDRLDASPPWHSLPLPDHEAHQAARMTASDRRAAFVRGRQLLRFLLAELLRCRPEDVPLQVLPSGKPVLGPDDGGALPQISLTHTGPWVACAISRAGAVGIDLERSDRLVDHEAITRRYFAAEERAALEALEPDARHEAFFRVWARKEALVKATGDGLSGTLDQVAVPVTAAAVVPLQRAPSAWSAQGPWWLHDLLAPAGTQGAIALPQASVAIARCRWG